MSALTAPAPATSHHINFSDWVVGIGIDRAGTSSGEIRQVGRLLLQMGADVVRHARVRGNHDDDGPETHENTLAAAEFLLGMARAFGDEADAMDLSEQQGGVPKRGQRAGTF